VRPAEVVRAAADRHEVPLEQLPEHLLAAHSADGLDFRPGHGLAVGHDRQRLEGRRREPVFRRRRQEPPHPGPEGRAGEQLETACDLLDAECSPALIVEASQIPQERAGLRAVGKPRQLRQPPRRQGLPRDKQRGLEPGEVV